MRKGERFLLDLKGIEELTEMQCKILNQLRMSLLPSGIRYDTVRVQTSPHDRFAEVEAEVVDREAKLTEKIRNDLRKKERILEVVRRLSPIEQRIVRMRFQDELELTTISESLKCTYRHTQRLYKKTIDDVEKIIGGENEKNDI